MASPPAPPGAASSTPSSSFSFPNLPIELNDQIFQHLHLVDHQINFTLAVMPAIGKIQASRLLVKALTDNFFLHRKNRNSLFGKGGIAGHKANNPDIVPTQHDRNLVNSTATTFKELLSVAHQQDNKDWIRRLEESKQAETAKYLKNAVLSSRRMRRGDLKPNAQRKCTLGLATTDTRDYTQLLEEHDPVSAIWAAISDAKAEDEAKEIVSGNNLEALEKLCRALLKDGREFRHVCRGSCDPELSLYTTKVDRVLRAGSAKDQRIFLPVCSGCRALYLEGTMIEASRLSIFQDHRAQPYMSMPNGNTSWFRPQELLNGSQALQYYSKDEVALLCTMLCRFNDDQSIIERPASITDDKIAQICHRFKWVQDVVEEIAFQYIRKNARPLGISTRRREVSDLSAFDLPPWFMELLYKEFDMKVETLRFAQKAANFVAAKYDAHLDQMSNDEGHWRSKVAAAFWREHTAETFDQRKWLKMLDTLHIVIVTSWEPWLPIGSALRADAHFIEAATAYCQQIHQNPHQTFLKPAA